MNKTSKRSNLKLLILLGIFLFFAVFLLVMIKNGQIQYQADTITGTNFSLSTPKSSYNVGEIFVATVTMKTVGIPVSGADIKIDYDNQNLDVVDSNGNISNVITKGSIFYEYDHNSVAVKTGDSTKNTIKLTGHFLPGSSTSYNGTGTFATINFKVKAVKASSPIAFQFTKNATNDTNLTQYGGTIGADVLDSVTNLNLGLVNTPPSVTLTSNPSQITVGGSSTLSWSVTGAATCNSSGDWTVGAKTLTNGSESTGALTAVKTYNYILTCANIAGATTSKTATINVTQPPRANIRFSLQARSKFDISGVELKAFVPGSTTSFTIDKSGLTSDATGAINNIDVTGLSTGTSYDFYLYVNSYLAGKITNQSVSTFPVTLTFGELKGGDIDGNSRINSIDYALYQASDARADINNDGEINNSDFNIISANWPAN